MSTVISEHFCINTEDSEIFWQHIHDFTVISDSCSEAQFGLMPDCFI